ncbi:MAG: hypothetical protein RSE18_08425 [Acinetobacter sp.]
MNLIELLGGYERAKHEFEMIKEMKPIYPGEIETNDRLLLEYRRQHNIFEVGDAMVIPSRGNGIFHFNTLFSDSDIAEARHATDAEIAAGHRL